MHLVKSNLVRLFGGNELLFLKGESIFANEDYEPLDKL